MEGGPPRFRQDFSCPVLLRIPASSLRFRIRGLHPLWRAFPNTSPTLAGPIVRVLQPRRASTPVWPSSLSLAATHEVSFDFFSSGYLDVSVPPVRPSQANLFTCGSPPFRTAGFPHSEISGSMHAGVLPEAYRSLTNVLHRLSLPRYPPYTLSSFYFSGILISSMMNSLCTRRKRLPKGQRFRHMGSRLLSCPDYSVVKDRPTGLFLVGVPGLEPGTSSLSGTRSNQLSHTPLQKPVVIKKEMEKESFVNVGALTRKLCGPIKPHNLLKGGDPAPGSPRATLLRLHPSHQPDRRRSPQKLESRLQVRSTPMV